MSKSPPGVKEILQIGMEDAAQWMPDGKKLKHVGNSPAHWRYLTAIPNSLYAFACDGVVLFIGKTNKTLSKRFAGYCDPSSPRATDKRLNLAIMKLIRQKKNVRILVLTPTVPLNWGDYPINLAAGLEDSLVEAFKPEWNKIKGRILSETQALEEIAT